MTSTETAESRLGPTLPETYSRAYGNIKAARCD
jgi:hypothetical protein